MWKLLLLFLASTALAQTPGPTEKPFVFPEFRECGLVTRYASNKIAPACLQEANNLFYDEDFSLLRRNGYAQYNMTPCQDSSTVRGLWKFDAVDGTHYMVIFSSRSFFQTSGEGSCTPIPGWSGFSATAEMECVQTLGALWCANGVDSLSYWTGTATAAVVNAPIAPHIGAFRNRVWLGDVSGSRTRVRGSGELDGTDWALQIPGRSTTPVSIDIAGTNDGNPVSCLMGEYQGAFYIGRPDDLHALYGYDRRDFTLRKISKEIGCTEPKSVQEKNNALYWLSKRGVERLTGTTIERASDPIRPLIDTIIQAAGNTFTQTMTSQADFTGGNAQFCAAGPLSCTSAQISAGNVVVSSFSSTDEYGPDFSMFASSVNVSTNIVSGLVTLAIETMTFTNASSLTGWTNYFSSTGNPTGFEVLANSNLCNPSGTASFNPTTMFRSDIVSNGNGCSGTGDTAGIKAEVFASNGVMIASTTIFSGPTGTAPSTCSTTTIVFPDSFWILNQSLSAKVRFSMTGNISGGSSRDYTNSPTLFESPLTSPLGNTIQFSHRTLETASNNCVLDFAFNTANHFFASGNFVSRTMNTNISTPTWGPFEASFSSAAFAALTFQTQTSANGSTFDALVTATPGLEVQSSQKQYIRYKPSFSRTVSTQTAALDSVGLSARTTAYYISDCFTPNSTISSWNSFLTNNVPDNGSFTFWTSTGTTCAQASSPNAAWVPQVPNSAVSNATSTFIAVRILFNIDVGTQNPTLNDLTFSWNEGASRPPVASAVYRDRYWLFFTSSTLEGAHNDHAVVADSDDKWSLMDDIRAYSAAVWNRKLYTGDSLATGLFYQQDTGQDDNGNPYTMSIRTADIAMDNPAQLKVLKTVYVYLQPPTDATQNIAPTFTYQIDGSTVTYPLGSPNLTESAEAKGYFVAKLPVPAGQPSTFKWFNLGMEFRGDTGPLRVFGIQVIFENLEWQ